MEISPEIQKLNDSYLAEKGKRYGLQCKVRFEPDNGETPAFLIKKGYDYIARERECELVFTFQNVSSNDFPGVERPVINVESLDDKEKVFHYISSQSVKKMKLGETCEVKVPVNRRWLNGDIKIQIGFIPEFIETQYLPNKLKGNLPQDGLFEYPNVVSIAYFPREEHKDLIEISSLMSINSPILSTKESLRDGGLAYPNSWTDYFYVLSLDKEIEETRKHDANERSKTATLISTIAVCISAFTLFVLSLNIFVDIPKFHISNNNNQTAIEKTVIEKPTNGQVMKPLTKVGEQNHSREKAKSIPPIQ